MVNIDFLQRLKDHMEGLLYTPPTVSIGLYNESGNSVAIRPSPANINERHMNKGKIYPFNVQILVHNRENDVAYSTIEKLFNEYDNISNGAITSSDGSFDLISVNFTTTPNFVQKSSYGYLWTAIFQAELYIIGGNK